MAVKRINFSFIRLLLFTVGLVIETGCFNTPSSWTAQHIQGHECASSRLCYQTVARPNLLHLEFMYYEDCIKGYLTIHERPITTKNTILYIQTSYETKYYDVFPYEGGYRVPIPSLALETIIHLLQKKIDIILSLEGHTLFVQPSDFSLQHTLCQRKWKSPVKIQSPL